MALDRNARCEASGLIVRSCISSDLCDCFPDEDDPHGLHPEYFRVGVPGMTQAEQAAREHDRDCSLPEGHEPPCRDARDDYLG